MKKKCNNIIISFPRSGLNWIRWNVEYFTGRPTPGCTRIVPNRANSSDFVFHRTHHVYKDNPYNWSCNRKFYSKKGKPLYKNVMLLLRNPYELYGRFKKTEEKLEPKLMLGYVNNLKAYHYFKGRKIIIYYENLITHYHREMRRVFRFLRIKAHLSDVDVTKLKEDSLKSYNERGNTDSKQQQLSDASSQIYHSKVLTNKEKQELTDFLKLKLNVNIRNRYLIKYNSDLGDIKK